MHPAQRYITFLHFHQKRPVEEIVDRLRKFYILSSNAELLDEWTPKPEHKKLLTHEDIKYLKDQNKSQKLRKNLLFNRNVRVVIDTMILHGYEANTIAESLRLSGYHNIDEETITRYNYFFFDPALLSDIEEFEQFVQSLPAELKPEEHRSAFYNPWVGQLFNMNVLVPTDFERLTETALSIAYSRLLDDFRNKKNNIPFSDLMRLATRAQELKARLNLDTENKLLIETLNKLSINLEPIKNKTFDELVKSDEEDLF